jgi:hypothetical protein
VPVTKIEAAVVRRDTSRAGDPHRHLHVQINARALEALGAACTRRSARGGCRGCSWSSRTRTTTSASGSARSARSPDRDVAVRRPAHAAAPRVPWTRPSCERGRPSGRLPS